jgi:hypothetical protein
MHTSVTEVISKCVSLSLPTNGQTNYINLFKRYSDGFSLEYVPFAHSDLLTIRTINVFFYRNKFENVRVIEKFHRISENIKKIITHNFGFYFSYNHLRTMTTICICHVHFMHNLTACSF